MTIFEIQKDGDTIFDNKENFNSEDVIITNSIVKQKINKTIKLFYIDYDKNMNNFFIKSLTKDVYFSLIVTKFYLQYSNFYYMKIGRVVVIIAINTNKNNIKVKIKKHENIIDEQIYNFTNKDIPITIGRKLCTVNIDNNSVSKLHAIINYDEQINEYFISDENSTNGTQLLLHEDKIVEINGKMRFYIGEKCFMIEKEEIK